MYAIRRCAGVVGLAAVAVIAVQLMREDLSVTDAAWRAGGVLAVAIAATVMMPMIVRAFAATLDRP